MPDITPSYGNACCADFPECSHPPRVDRMPVIKHDDFASWLAATHPEVRLTDDQWRWVAQMEHDRWVTWTGGRRGGRTFVVRLWEEYSRA